MPNYEVSNLGNVRRSTPGRKTYAGRMMKLQTMRIGYVSVAPTVNGKNVTIYVHDAVARAFLGPKPEGASVNHKDGNKTNNVPANLEYVTHAENMRHAARSGLMRHGEDHAQSKLTERGVEQIRADRAAGMSFSQIAKKHGICISHSWQIVKGNAWSRTA